MFAVFMQTTLPIINKLVCNKTARYIQRLLPKDYIQRN